jgi:hypothetical protein
MLRLLKNKKAQNTIEYALIIAVVIGAFTAMQLYNRRAISMRVKRGMDRLPIAIMGQEQNRAGGMAMFPGATDDWEPILGDKTDTQYEPYYYAVGTYNMTVTSTEGNDTAYFGTTAGNRTLTGQSVRRTGEQEVTGTTYRDVE